MGLFVMSARELDRLKVIEDIEAHRLSVVQGAELAGVSRRQMTRLVRAFKDKGATGLISKKRGKPSNRRYSDGYRDYVLELVRLHYADFGPTFPKQGFMKDASIYKLASFTILAKCLQI